MTDADPDVDALWRPGAADAQGSGDSEPSESLERDAPPDSPWAPNASTESTSRFMWSGGARSEVRSSRASSAVWQPPAETEPEQPGMPVFESPRQPEAPVEEAAREWRFGSDASPGPAAEPVVTSEEVAVPVEVEEAAREWRFGSDASPGPAAEPVVTSDEVAVPVEVEEAAREWRFGSDASPGPAAESVLATREASDGGEGVGALPVTPEEVTVDPADVEVHRLESTERIASGRRVMIALAAAAVLIVALVAVRSITGESPERADGPRLPASVDERWQVPLGDRFVVDAVVTELAVVVVTGQQGLGGTRVSAHDLRDGTELWRQPVDSMATTLHVVDADDAELVVVSAIREFADGRQSIGIDPATGAHRWERRDGIVLTRPEMGRIAVVEAGRFPSTGPGLELIDMVTGVTIPPVGGRLVGLGADGEILAIDDEGDVRVLDVAGYDPEMPDREIESTLVATTAPDRNNVFRLGGRYFAAADDVVVEIGFAPDAGRVLLDRRPEDQRSRPLPPVTSSAFFVQVDDRHAVMLSADGAIGLELADDELRVRWSEGAVTELVRQVDGGRAVVHAVDATEPGDAVGSEFPTRLVDAVTGETLVDFTSIRQGAVDQPVDGVFGWSSVMGEIGTDADVERAGTLVAFDLDGTERWSIDDVVAGAFLGDRLVVIERADGDTSDLVLIDEGPGSRD